MTTQFFTEEYLQALAEDGFAPAPRRPVALVPDDFFTEEYVAAVLEDLAAEAARSGSGDGDDDGGPAPAAPAARPVRPFSVTTVTGGAVYLTAEELAEWNAFEAAVAETWDPVPCDQCGKAAAPAVETDEGLTLCLSCGEAEPSALPAVRTWRLRLTCQRIACARASRQLAGVR